MARAIHNRLVNKILDKEIAHYGEKYLTGRMLDIGCGTKPYSEILYPFISEHIGLDRESPFNDRAEVDVVGMADDIPLPAESFDSVLCAAVLEHLPEPEAALRECHRVLRPGGVALYTVPMIWHLHGIPWDYYRFTRYGLDHIFRKTGFDVVEIKPLSGFWVTVGQLFSYYVMRFNRKPLSYLRIIPIGTLLIQAIAGALDRLDRAEDWTWMYLVIARKP